MVFCNLQTTVVKRFYVKVTILILIDGFLQYDNVSETEYGIYGHNPYFNRWFSAMF